uniref:Uncharacterized protein n=1 Tax=Anguilla anguilla TaxID=7936 RepID=A0A0E9QNN7_ANGAN
MLWQRIHLPNYMEVLASQCMASKGAPCRLHHIKKKLKMFDRIAYSVYINSVNICVQVQLNIVRFSL